MRTALAKIDRKRTPHGQYSRAGQQKEFPPAQIRRLRDAAMTGLRDAKWGTELGRLYLAGIIDEIEFSAGEKIAELWTKDREAIGAFPVRSLSMERGSISTPPDPLESTEGLNIAAREAALTERLMESRAILISAGKMAEYAVRRVCVENLSLCGAAELNAAKRGLVILSQYYGLTKSAK